MDQGNVLLIEYPLAVSRPIWETDSEYKLLWYWQQNCNNDETCIQTNLIYKNTASQKITYSLLMRSVEYVLEL